MKNYKIKMERTYWLLWYTLVTPSVFNSNAYYANYSN